MMRVKGDKRWRERQGTGQHKIVYIVNNDGTVSGMRVAGGITFENGVLHMTQHGTTVGHWANVRSIKVQ